MSVGLFDGAIMQSPYSVSTRDYPAVALLGEYCAAVVPPSLAYAVGIRLVARASHMLHAACYMLHGCIVALLHTVCCTLHAGFFVDQLQRDGGILGGGCGQALHRQIHRRLGTEVLLIRALKSVAMFAVSAKEHCRSEQQCCGLSVPIEWVVMRLAIRATVVIGDCCATAAAQHSTAAARFASMGLRAQLQHCIAWHGIAV